MTEEFSQPTRPVSPPRILRRERDGGLFDVELERSVSLAELAGDVKDGRRFRVSRAETGAGCTNEVLLEVLREALPDLSPTIGGADAAGSATGLLDQLTQIVADRRGGSRTGPS